MKICRDCKHSDVWRLRKSDMWICHAEWSRKIDPVTGDRLPRYERCGIKNIAGNCAKFEPKPPKWGWLWDFIIN